MLTPRPALNLPPPMKSLAMLLPHLAMLYTTHALDMGNAPVDPPEGYSSLLGAPLNATHAVTGPGGRVFALSSHLLGDALCSGTVTPATAGGVPWTQGLGFFGLCAPRNNYALFASLQLDRTGPFASPAVAPNMVLYITYGEFCDPAIFNPAATNPYNYEAIAVGPTSSTLATSVPLTAFCSDQQCCAIALCNDVRGCGTTSLSVTYTAPTTGPCDSSNSGPFTIPGGNFLSPNIGRCTTSGQGDITKTTQSLTVSNPNNHLISVFQTGGAFCQNFFNLEGSVASNFRFYGTASELTTATSVSLTNACVQEPCCSQIWCWSSNQFGCRSMRYAVSFKQDSPAAALAAGIIAAIVIGVVVFAVIAGVMAWRARVKYYSPQQTYTSQVVLNPASPGIQAWGQTNEPSRV